jgi:hypothetical protein
MFANTRVAFATTILVATISALSATTETPRQRQACICDAFQSCRSAISNRDRVFACLADNGISAGCHTS